MICERCENDHDGSYGSGRFCSSYCARGFSTSENREEINRQVSAFLTGKLFHKLDCECPICSPRAIWNERIKVGMRRHYDSRDFDQLGPKKKRLVIITEQVGCCLLCGLDKWLEGPIYLELDHIDGNNTNWIRENLRALCRNCHAQTPTYGNKRRARVLFPVSN